MLYYFCTTCELTAVDKLYKFMSNVNTLADLEGNFMTVTVRIIMYCRSFYKIYAAYEGDCF